MTEGREHEEHPKMSTMQSQRVERYLAELDAALAHLPAGERAEVVSGIREHIEAAVADRDSVTDGDVDQVLRSLGDPLAIAAEASRDEPGGTGEDGNRTWRTGFDAGSAGARTTGLRPQLPVLERDWVPGAVVATLLLGVILAPLFVSFGGIFLLPFLLVGGWAMLWISPLWPVGEKLAGTFLLPALGVAMFSSFFFAFGVTSSQTCEGTATSNGDYTEVCSPDNDAAVSYVAIAVLILVAAASITTAVVLFRRGRRRSREAAERLAAASR